MFLEPGGANRFKQLQTISSCCRQFRTVSNSLKQFHQRFQAAADSFRQFPVFALTPCLLPPNAFCKLFASCFKRSCLQASLLRSLNSENDLYKPMSSEKLYDNSEKCLEIIILVLWRKCPHRTNIILSDFHFYEGFIHFGTYREQLMINLLFLLFPIHTFSQKFFIWILRRLSNSI